MTLRTEIADVAKLYAQAAADSALVEIELDTRQLRAISREEAAAIMDAADLNATPANDSHYTEMTPELNDSLEALLRLSWPLWKGSLDSAQPSKILN